MFEMLRVNGAGLPVYVHRTSVRPHVNIRPTGSKARAGEGLAAAELVEEAAMMGGSDQGKRG
jgi:hypothetical protein